jgi:hypothetical protein
MSIEFDPSTGDIFLKINGEPLCHYPSVDVAAHDVYFHETGYYDWDKLRGSVTPPKNITEWEKKSVGISQASQFRIKYHNASPL